MTAYHGRMSTVHDESVAATLAALDLNLFVAFEAIARERSLTRAAQRLGVTQSAMSHALRRLRQLLGDELLVRGAGGMVLTPRAEALLVPVQSGLTTLARALTTPARFEPALARRAFRLATPDLFDLLVIPPLLDRLRVEAPLIDLVVITIDPRAVAVQLETGQVDLAVMPAIDGPGAAVVSGPPLGLVRRGLFRDQFGCLMRRGHPALRKARGRPRALSLAAYAELPHVLVSPTGEGPGVMDPELSTLGQRRRVVLRVPHFATALAIVAKSDLVLTAPSMMGRLAEDDVAMVALPAELGGAPHAVQIVWHERFTQDPAHVWLRDQLAAVARAFTANAPKA
jgi:DNA-binding transcriptional LysR family regulator